MSLEQKKVPNKGSEERGVGPEKSHKRNEDDCIERVFYYHRKMSVPVQSDLSCLRE